MTSALSGFVLIGAIVLAGWAARRWSGLPDDAQAVLGGLAYTVLSPCLLFTAAAGADLHLLLSEPLLVSAAAAGICFGSHVLVSWLAPGERTPGATVTGALAAGYVNANNIGIPVATYVLGDATLAVPIIVLQVLIITPLVLALLEAATTGRVSPRAILAAPLRNPLVIAVALGVLVSAFGLHVPAIVARPVATIGAAAVPVVLIAFGMSLSGRRVLAARHDRVPTIAAVILKIVVMPVVALTLALALGLPPQIRYAVTVLAALPTAQNVFLFAQRFGAGLTLVRDATFLSTVGCVPVLLLTALLLG
ncbi:AEC family transporter [Mangrovihabitans endophyticus]|uniref:Membrane protein n=1 Tax=Mangrovihabitans endophyticus TaxID=1751298 RepID=A0A8J3BYE5_9ACTN|nr:AEC family transporter [Mangrovihabitans endophyticus]GGK84255.1 membrane protein [Mangrovihabitans endophyticus]